MDLAQLPLVAGILLSWSLAAPPGPINALMAHAAARRGFLAGWAFGLGAITGDMTMLALTGLGVLRVVDVLPWLKVAFALVGAGLMAWFAWGAFQTAHRVRQAMGPDADDEPEPWRRSFLKSYVIVVTSPYNWGWWLTAGSSMLTLFGLVVGAGFFVGLLVWTAGWCGLARTGAARLSRFTETVAYAAALVLAVFAVVMLAYAATTAWSLAAAHP